MIKPAKLTGPADWESLVKENEGSNLFFINSAGRAIRAISLVYVRKFNYPIHDVIYLWHIETGQDGILRREIKSFYIELSECSREEFISHLSTNYPEYMEWFLFNKEWLD